MYKINLKGRCIVESVISEDNHIPATTNQLESLDGTLCDTEFTEYFGSYENSIKDKVSDGYMSFQYENNQLYAITTYLSTVRLTNSELNILIDYTQGQCSDGIGEGFSQRLVNECYINPWFNGQVITSEQIKLSKLEEDNLRKERIIKKLNRNNNQLDEINAMFHGLNEKIAKLITELESKCELSEEEIVIKCCELMGVKYSHYDNHRMPIDYFRNQTLSSIPKIVVYSGMSPWEFAILEDMTVVTSMSGHYKFMQNLLDNISTLDLTDEQKKQFESSSIEKSEMISKINKTQEFLKEYNCHIVINDSTKKINC